MLSWQSKKTSTSKIGCKTGCKNDKCASVLEAEHAWNRTNFLQFHPQMQQQWHKEQFCFSKIQFQFPSQHTEDSLKLPQKTDLVMLTSFYCIQVIIQELINNVLQRNPMLLPLSHSDILSSLLNKPVLLKMALYVWFQGGYSKITFVSRFCGKNLIQKEKIFC